MSRLVSCNAYTPTPHRTSRLQYDSIDFMSVLPTFLSLLPDCNSNITTGVSPYVLSSSSASPILSTVLGVPLRTAHSFGDQPRHTNRRVVPSHSIDASGVPPLEPLIGVLPARINIGLRCLKHRADIFAFASCRLSLPGISSTVQRSTPKSVVYLAVCFLAAFKRNLPAKPLCISRHAHC